MNPNPYLAVAVPYPLKHRPQWPIGAAVGKTLVSSALIDRVVAGLKRRLVETPVGFKWFSPGLLDGGFCFGGEESALFVGVLDHQVKDLHQELNGLKVEIGTRQKSF